jgi:small subunit ribosomal protein S8
MSMTSTDPIADLLTRIRNAMVVRRREIRLPHSGSKLAIAEQLQAAGFVSKVRVEPDRVGQTLVITIWNEGENPRITSLTRLSKPGRRSYVRAGGIPTVKRGRGIVVVSTSKGMMTGAAAKQQGIGGELICEVY